MNIRVVEHRSEWHEEFLKESHLIRKGIQDNIINVYHVGSTAVEGLMAKPIIDMLLVVKSLEVLDHETAFFESLGYEVMGEFGISKRRYFRKGGDDRTHHIHAFKYDNLYEIERHLLFRDYLREHPQRREDYGTLKLHLATIHPNDIDLYGDGKAELVREIEKEAIIWHFEKR